MTVSAIFPRRFPWSGTFISRLWSGKGSLRICSASSNKAITPGLEIKRTFMAARAGQPVVSAGLAEKSGSRTHRKRQAGVIVSDYTTLMVEILKDNARREAAEVYGAMDMDWAKLVGQIAHA